MSPGGQTSGIWKEVLAPEIADQNFCPNTKALFSAFLQLVRLPVADFVTDPVAQVLNKLLDSLGAFGTPINGALLETQVLKSF